MSVKVGINENVFISKVRINDKQRLEITFTSKTQEKKSEFEMLNAVGQIQQESNSLTLNMFEFRVPDKADMDIEAKQERVLADIMEYKNKLDHILSVFMKQSDIQFNWSANTGITGDNIRQMILDKEVLQVVYMNLSTQFIAMIEPFLPEERPLRLKLCRQSTDKHYATIPSSRFGYVHEKKSGFLEPMEIPSEQSSLAFSKYEKDKKLDIDGPIASDQADENTSEAPVSGSPFASR